MRASRFTNLGSGATNDRRCDAASGGGGGSGNGNGNGNGATDSYSRVHDTFEGGPFIKKSSCASTGSVGGSLSSWRFIISNARSTSPRPRNFSARG